MPNACSCHGDNQVAAGAAYAVTVAAKRDVEIVAEPSGERDVPSMPELREVAAVIGEGKVLAQTDAEHCCNADADVAVAAEIQIDLHGETNKSHQALETRIGIRHGENPVVVLGNVVGHNPLLDDANDNEPQSHVEQTFAEHVLPLDLWEEGLCPGDGACQKEWEEREVEEVFPKADLEAEVTSIDIHRIADGLEGIEGNADGHCNACQREVCGKHLTQQFREGMTVFEVEKRQQVEHDDEEKQSFSLGAFLLGHPFCQPP